MKAKKHETRLGGHKTLAETSSNEQEARIQIQNSLMLYNREEAKSYIRGIEARRGGYN